MKTLNSLALRFIPITLILDHAGKVPPPVIFFSAALAIVPVASLIVRSTEQLARADRRRRGRFASMHLRQCAELIIALVALKAGYADMVRASIIGAILANLLLALGMAFFLGGLRHLDQKIQSGCRTPIQLDDAIGRGQPRRAERVQPLLRTGRHDTAGRAAQSRNRRLVAADVRTLLVIFPQDASRRVRKASGETRRNCTMAANAGACRSPSSPSPAHRFWQLG